jgi:ribonuclease PH
MEGEQLISVDCDVINKSENTFSTVSSVAGSSN